MDRNEMYNSCRLCGLACGVNRHIAIGGCKEGADIRIARAALHMWEEPIISGEGGSGTIFFSGCSLGCVFCQNRRISHEGVGRVISVDELSQIMLSLEDEGAHNINLVTPTHVSPKIAMAIDKARSHGLKIPIVYNTSSYDSIDTMRMLDGLVDIYLADYKFNSERLASKYTRVKNYTKTARIAIAEMVRQRGRFLIGEDGLMKSGVIIRLLLLPTHLIDAKMSLKYLYNEYSDNVYFSLMSQYTPIGDITPPLNRCVSESEYNSLIDYADSLGIKYAFTQQASSVGESFIPEFFGE